jgi:hypothetical protein
LNDNFELLITGTDFDWSLLHVSYHFGKNDSINGFEMNFVILIKERGSAPPRQVKKV